MKLAIQSIFFIVVGLAVVGTMAHAQAPQGASQQSALPPAKQISTDDMIMKIGMCTILSDAKDQRISQLEQRIQSLAQELEDLKKKGQ